MSAGSETKRARVTKTVSALRTPALICYKSVLEGNAARMRERASSLGCTLRPHVKTMKTVEGAMVACGGTKGKITVSTLAEAFFFADGGFEDMIYAVPLSPDKIEDAEALSGRCANFHVMVDHADQVEPLASRPATSRAMSPCCVRAGCRSTGC